jgi:asparagine synthase (glutamine-hydrolysing)
MCGIAGVASSIAPVADRRVLMASCDAMAHRGPDDSGIWWSDDARVGLGHRRLAVIDLSAAGHQPMLDDVGAFVITFNGEIYNFGALRADLRARGHEFRSFTDTEVLLAAYREWGEQCLCRLVGMFAFAIYDTVRQRLFLARDRAGEKPLFYRVANGTLSFGSELKALFADRSMPRVVDLEALDCYLAIGYVAGDRCILQGVRKLPPAHCLTFELGSGELRVRRYWSPPDAPSVDSESDDGALLAELEALLETSVRDQLVADVSVGVLLSGGVDSSLITAMAVRCSARVKTFTVRFPGHVRFDETEHARLIAKHFGTEHLELSASDVSVDLLSSLAAQFDEPIVDSSMIPTFLVSRLIRQHCTVALGGDGGDELFGGYPQYNRMLRLQQHTRSVPRLILRGTARVAAHALPIGFRGRSFLTGIASDFDTTVPFVSQIFDPSARQRLTRAGLTLPAAAERLRESRLSHSGDLLRRATIADFENYLPEDILVKVDRASMLNSLEVRAPMLDHRIIEFAFGRVPTRLKATLRARKILLKRLCARVLPKEFDQQRKHGFSIPIGTWLRGGPWRDLVEDTLLDANDSTFDRGFVRGLLNGQKRGRSNEERLFALTLFELWRQHYQVVVG